MPNEPQEKPDLIIDTDWKSQVQAEKESLREKQTKPPDDDSAMDESLPPASFGMLLSTLATQALMCLGQQPHPMEGKPVIRLEEARHFIDTLAILEEKTQGNLTPDEQEMLTGVLHDLRMLFVAAKSAKPTPQPPE